MKKKYIYSIVIMLFMLVVLLNFRQSLMGARKGLLLWYNTLFPTLMPFMLLSNLLVLLNCTEFVGSLLKPFTHMLRLSTSCGYCILVGFLCGYPMGAYVSSLLREERLINDEENEYLTSVCNNVSPMFMISYVSVYILENEKYALMVIAAISGSAIISIFFLRLFYSRPKKGKNILEKERKSNMVSSCSDKKTLKGTSTDIKEALEKSIDKTITASLNLCIFIMIFSIIGELTDSVTFLSDITKAVIISIFEISAGLEKISKLSIPFNIKYILCTTLTTFGGISSVFQTMSISDKSGLDIWKYVRNKLIISAICLFLSLFIVTIVI